MRSRVEWLCRLGALGLLGWSLASAVGGRPAPASGASVATGLDSANTARQLTAWTRRPDLAALHLTLAHVPDAEARDWLRAIGRAGTRVSWSGDVPPIAVDAEPVADPRGGARVRVAAPAGAVVQVGDDVGAIDSITATQGGGAVRVATLVGGVHARTGAVAARAAAPPPRTLRDVVVLGAAGWETKFVAAALEEQGWTVTVRMPIAPGIIVGPAALTLDTARVSAVVALDSSAAREAAGIARFVRAGGGVVLGAGAARHQAFAPIVAGRAGAPVGAATSYAAAIAPVTRQTLAAAPITPLRPDAVALERRDGRVVLAARRMDAGRVLQLGYDETWRWRMAGGDDALEAHRRWWSEVVGAVAYAPVASAVGGQRSAVGDAAPRAALVAALGEPTQLAEAAVEEAAFDPSRSPMIYLAIAVLLLLEWGSRRWRGAK